MKNEVIEFLENKLAEYKQSDPETFNLLGAYEYVINDLLNEE